MKPLALVAVLFAAGSLGAAEAPTPSFTLIGDVTQKLTETAPGWTDAAGFAWSFAADLKPRFTYGAVSFVADTSWNLPLTASLTASTPTVSVYEAYFRATPVDGLDLTFGQKRFNLGVGQTFTVGDSLNPVIGFFDQKTGFRGATAEWSPASWVSASAAVTTDGTNPSWPLAAGQVSLLVDQLQVTASLVGAKDQSFNPALGASYDLFGVIVTAEGAAEYLPQGKRPSTAAAGTWTAPAAWTSPALSGSAGARWTVGLGTLGLNDIDLTLSAEYLHWGQGWNADETAAWNASLSPAKASALTAVHGVRGQENGFFRVTVASGTDLTVALFAAVDLTDRSVLGQGSVTWAPWDNLELIAALRAAGGTSGQAWETVDTLKNKYQASFATTYHF
jgi:hypothetical protein